MAGQVKVRASVEGEIVKVKALMTHPMETGNRKDKATGELVPEHFITVVECKHNGESVLTGNWGPSVSKNPFLSFELMGGKPGDTISIEWVDNKGEKGSGEAKIV
jgi:sulfur-oxidizing protein SoxZ